MKPTIRQSMEQVGPWTAHNIRLDDDLYTREPRVVGDEIRAKRILQIVSDVSGRPLSELRVVDLACLEGMFSIEMALHGAETLGIEGRRDNVDRARFAGQALGLSNLRFEQDDVRNLSADRYGEFDVVLSLGILYHLDAPDVFRFVEQMGAVCRGFAVIDTHIALAPKETLDYAGESYSGRRFVEHRHGSTQEQREELLWASLDNPTSFWLTRPSLFNLLHRAGFTSVYECHNPAYPISPSDRAVFVAIKGRRHRLGVSPLADSQPQATWAEGHRPRVSPGQRWYYRAVFLWSELVRSLPAPIKRMGRRLTSRS